MSTKFFSMKGSFGAETIYAFTQDGDLYFRNNNGPEGWHKLEKTPALSVLVMYGKTTFPESTWSQ